MSLRNPQGKIRSFSRDLLLGGMMLAGVIFMAVGVGQYLSEAQLANWGAWLGSFIAGIAMVATSYAIILQARQGESASWAIALSRLGQLYDQAHQNESLARLLVEPSDEAGDVEIDPDDLNFSAQETVWLGSIFLAYEQIYVATNSLTAESKRVWRLYLSNQLNKPTLRAAFVKDASRAKDYHQEFWRFARGIAKFKEQGGSEVKEEVHPRYVNYAIHPKHFEMADGRKCYTLANTDKKLTCKPAEIEDRMFWMEIYKDAEVKRQMYAAPTESSEVLWDYLSCRRVFTVWNGDVRIGGFSISTEKDLRATFGIVIHPLHRYRGHGPGLIELLNQEARKIGVRTLRADVYQDNLSCLSLLRRDGFRKFVWMEKNLV